MWNFGRTIRNAFAHDGQIEIRGPSAPPVTWKSLNYTHTDNGRQIFLHDMGEAEAILLMAEMDASV